MKGKKSKKTILIQCAAGIIMGFVTIFLGDHGIVTPECTYTMEESSLLLAGLFFGLPGGIISALIAYIYCLINYYSYLIYFVPGILGGLVYTFIYRKGSKRLFFGMLSDMISASVSMLFIIISNFENASYIMMIFNGGWKYVFIPNIGIVFVVLLAADLIDDLREKKEEKKNEKGEDKKKTFALTLQFQSVLAVTVIIGFVATVFSTYTLQTKVATSDAVQVIEANILDTVEDMSGSMEDYFYSICRMVKTEVKDADLTAEELDYIANKYSIDDIFLVGEDNVVFNSNDESLIGFDMNSTEQSAEFACLLNDKEEFSQEAMPKGSSPSETYMYTGVATDYGYVQIGIDEEGIKTVLEKDIIQAIKNRRIAKNGFIVVLSDDLRVIADGRGHQYTSMDVIGLEFDPETMNPQELIVTTYDGEEYYMEYGYGSGYYELGLIPASEVMQGRSLSNWVTILSSMIIFNIVFGIIYLLMHALVIKPIHLFNTGLREITSGNLDVVIEPKPDNVTEFYYLANDVNSTVRNLKELIDEAERRIEKELEFAKNIQEGALERVFPPFPDDKRFDLHATMDAAKDVGGDFYDFYFVDKDRICLTVADVSGKGIPAAMFMMTAKTLIKSNVLAGKPINEALRISNDELCAHNDAGMFVTCWAGILNLETGDMEFTCAGHNPPVLRHGNNPWEFHKSKINLVLAAMDGMPYDKNILHMDPGDEIFLYTDGVTEATNINDELYEEQRLADCLNSKSIETSSEICSYVRKSVDAFVGEAPQFDDITMLSFKYYGPAKEELK